MGMEGFLGLCTEESCRMYLSVVSDLVYWVSVGLMIGTDFTSG
jgi:hypothetical protein